MDINQMLKIGAEAFQSGIGEQLGGSLSIEKIMDALADLMPGEGKNVDLGALVGKMQGGGLASIAQSWLGDGGNAGIGADQLLSIFGGGDIMRFADKLGLDQDTALEGLRSAVPEMVDKASSGGTLESLGGAEGLMGMAGKLFGR
jgi:uncharacterized protein YidB (DUF937 family)